MNGYLIAFYSISTNATKYPTEKQLTNSILSTTHIWPIIHQLKMWTFIEVFKFHLNFFLKLYNLIISGLPDMMLTYNLCKGKILAIDFIIT